MEHDPHRQPHSFIRWGCLLFPAMVLFLVSGCGGASPRFAVHEKPAETQQETKKKGNIRFSSKESEEEKKEDDRKVDIPTVHKRFSGGSPPAKKKEQPVDRTPARVTPASPATATTFERQKMMDCILAWMGTPYEYGGESKSGIDCSAFTKEMFKESAGIDLPRSTAEQVTLGRPVAKDDLAFGDLVFFNTTGENPSHVGIYIGDDMFAHASVSFGVTLSSMYSSYYKKRYTEARRVIR